MRHEVFEGAQAAINALKCVRRIALQLEECFDLATDSPESCREAPKSQDLAPLRRCGTGNAL